LPDYSGKTKYLLHAQMIFELKKQMTVRSPLIYGSAIIILAIATAAGLVIYVNSGTQPNNNNVSSWCVASRVPCPYQSAGDCPSGQMVSQFTTASDNRSRSGELVLIMGQNSTVLLCITYENPSKGQSLNLSLNPFMGVGKWITARNGVREFNLSRTAEVSITTNVRSVRLVSGSNLTVAYLVESEPGSSGIYYISVPGACPAIPLAVGLSPGDLSAKSFPSFGPVPCPLRSYSASLSAGPGFQALYLPYA